MEVWVILLLFISGFLAGRYCTQKEYEEYDEELQKTAKEIREIIERMEG